MTKSTILLLKAMEALYDSPKSSDVDLAAWISDHLSEDRPASHSIPEIPATWKPSNVKRLEWTQHESWRVPFLNDLRAYGVRLRFDVRPFLSGDSIKWEAAYADDDDDIPFFTSDSRDEAILQAEKRHRESVEALLS